MSEELRDRIGAVIDRWYHLGMIRFSSRDDGSDDLLLRDELVRAALAASPSESGLREAVEFAAREFKRLGRENSALQMRDALSAAEKEAT